MSDKYVLMPEYLTAENGAKGLLIGEFSELIEMQCDCFDSDGNANDNCAVCAGSGAYERRVHVSWTTIKEIYAMAVKELSSPVASQQER